MGKKNKKEKGRGAEKTAKKMEKKVQKGEDMADLEAMIAQFKEADKQKTTYHEERCEHPSPRSSFTVCAHPERDELLLFGGEYYNGKKMSMYNELFAYNTKRGDWTHRFVPNAPPPRSGHQAVTVANDGGQMWVFGGEFSSPNNAQFYHYKDLWQLSLRECEWRQVKAKNGPTARSGHRMCAFQRNLFVFGGFHDSGRDFLYFNDCYLFSLTDFAWTKIAAGGTAPSPRSACQLLPAAAGVLVCGGYSKTRVKKDVEKGQACEDMHMVSVEANGKWRWRQVKQSGQKPWPRSGFTMAQTGPNRAVMFGGVQDEDLDEDLGSVFFNSMSCLDVVSHRWFNFDLRGAKAAASDDDDEEMDHDGAGTAAPAASVMPCPRMNSGVVVKRNIMYVYGGIVEQNNRQITLNDLWSIDWKKVDAWKELQKSDDTAKDWQGEGSGSSTCSFCAFCFHYACALSFWRFSELEVNSFVGFNQ